MMISMPGKFETYGGVRVFDLARVLALGSYRAGKRDSISVDYGELEKIAESTAIVVPVKDESLIALEGVLRAIPSHSPVILVSASSRKPADMFKNEVDLARVINMSCGREIMVLHQFDPAWGDALGDTHLEVMLEFEGVRRGKGEGMILGILASASLGARYVGFIDSDNYIPGAVHEYALIFYSGFSILDSKYSMVRISWPFKGKLASGDMYLRKRGRVSSITNNMINLALSRHRRVETDIVKTANSGEHALSIDLAMRIRWAGGFAVEPYQLVHLFESCYLGINSGSCSLLPEGVTILQVEAMNPHIHAERGDEHIHEMVVSSLGTIYHSGLADESIRKSIMGALREYGINRPPQHPRIYSLENINAQRAISRILTNSELAVYFEAR